MRRKSLHPAPANTQRREGFIFGKKQHRSVPVCKSPGCVSATEWRQVVATGASPWILFQKAFFSPSGTTGVSAALFMSSLRDSRSLFFSVHGLAPVATTCRPVGTTSHSFSQLLCSKTQCFVHRNFFTAIPKHVLSNSAFQFNVQTRKRRSILESINVDLEELRFQIRLARYLNCLSIKSDGTTAQKLVKIGKQVGGWTR